MGVRRRGRRESHLDRRSWRSAGLDVGRRGGAVRAPSRAESRRERLTDYRRTGMATDDTFDRARRFITTSCTSVTSPATASAIVAPSNVPATTSVNQCAFRYTLDNAITNANTTE